MRAGANTRRRRRLRLVALGFLLAARSAAAETLAAPVSARPIPLGPDRVACREPALGGGWAVEPDGHAVRPPTSAEAVGQSATLRVAPTEAACGTSTATVALVAIGPKPVVDGASVVLEPEAGRLVARGKRLRGTVLSWATAAGRQKDVCSTPESGGGTDVCSFAVPRDLPADAAALELALLPNGLAGASDVVLFDAAGRRTAFDEYALRPAQIVLTHIVAADAAVDVSSGTGRVPLLHPEAVASVDCTDATCALEGRDIVVRGEHGPDDKLEVRVQLRPHVVVRNGTSLEPVTSIAIPLQRCPITLASPRPLAGLVEQRVVVRIAARCARGDEDLEFEGPAGMAAVERTELLRGDRWVVLRIGAVDTGATVRVRRRGTVVGIASLAPQPMPSIHARLEIPDHGPIDFVPRNRPALVRVPKVLSGGALEPLPIEGVYDVRRDEKGAFWVRAAEGATGAASLRFGYVDPALPPPLAGTRLAEVVEPVSRGLRDANVPVALGALVRDKDPLVEVVCGDGEGRLRRLSPDATASIPFRARDSCKVVIHRERLRLEDGAQAFQVSVQVTGSDGVPRTDARLERKMVLRHGAAPTYVALAGATSPFDRILVRVALADDETHYAAEFPEKGAPQAAWPIVTGTDHARLYGTAAIPTGLFRVADSGHSGILTLSVGALLRAVLLSRDGTEFPVGLEAGVMWLGIAGDTDPSAASRGAVALVAGPGIAVPIANVSRATQTSISLHGWFEYEVSRSILAQSGQAFGFVFGPSISIGDVGTNL